MNILRKLLRIFKTDDPHLQMVKGGQNDLHRWEAFGGQLKRPPPPADIERKSKESET